MKDYKICSLSQTTFWYDLCRETAFLTNYNFLKVFFIFEIQFNIKRTQANF